MFDSKCSKPPHSQFLSLFPADFFLTLFFFLVECKETKPEVHTSSGPYTHLAETPTRFQMRRPGTVSRHERDFQTGHDYNKLI